MLLRVSVNKPSSGSLLPCFAKVMIIKIRGSQLKYVVMKIRSVVWLHIYPVLYWCVCSHTIDLIFITTYFN
jgi:hypothetical protein